MFRRISVVLTVAAMLILGTVAAVRPHHPQDEAVAKGPRPYTDMDVSFSNDHAGVKLGGTFSVPNGKGPFPAVLLIAAAGREDRDEVAGGHKVFLVLADSLLRRGIAVLRYDKRGVGASTGDFEKAKLEDLLDDAACAFRYLRARPEVDARHVGIIGHSEGGTLAPGVASLDSGVAFVVAMAGSGLNGQFRTTNALQYQVKEKGGTAQEVEATGSVIRRIFSEVSATPDDAAAAARITSLIDEAVATHALTAAQGTFLQQTLKVRLVREALTDDPLQYLRKVRVPVLALVGSLDNIMPASAYVPAMQPVLASIPGSRVEVLPKLNHVFQTATTGSPSEFASIEETISPLALKTIGDWVQAQVTRTAH